MWLGTSGHCVIIVALQIRRGAPPVEHSQGVMDRRQSLIPTFLTFPRPLPGERAQAAHPPGGCSRQRMQGRGKPPAPAEGWAGARDGADYGGYLLSPPSANTCG